MSYKLEFQKHGDRALICPIICCDYCNRQITNAGWGVCLWEMDPAGNEFKAGIADKGKPYFAHKITCHDQLAARIRGNRDSGGYWMELDSYMAHLKSSLGLPLTMVEKERTQGP